MDAADRIAAYLADELDDAQRRTFEDDLDRDAALRADLDAVRRADDALAAEAPTVLPAGAADRLRERLRDEFDDTLAAGTAETDAGADTPVSPGGAAPATFTASATDGGDELAARRRRRGGAWTAIGGVAAALVAVVAVGQLELGSGDDAGDEMAMDAAEDDSGGAMMESEAADTGFAPLLRASGRSLTEAEAAALLDDPDALALAGARLEGSAARDVATANAAAFGVDRERAGAAGTMSGDDLADTDATDDADAPSGEAPLAEPESSDEAQDGERLAGAAPLRVDGDLDPATRDAVGACLEVLLAGGGDPIVTTAETVVFDGEEAVAFTLVGRSPDDVASRPEVWVMTLDGCQTRFLRQAD